MWSEEPWPCSLALEHFHSEPERTSTLARQQMGASVSPSKESPVTKTLCPFLVAHVLMQRSDQPRSLCSLLPVFSFCFQKRHRTSPIPLMGCQVL